MPEKTYKQIVVLSGKGGTGKTTFTAAMAYLLNNKIIIDCDVDAANLYLILKPGIKNNYDFYGGKKASIDSDKCEKCQLCESICRFNAIKDFIIDQLSCEGCGLCFRVCPNEAITFNSVQSGFYYEGELADKTKLYYAKLFAGQGNSGKLVSAIKRKAVENITSGIEWVIVDGPPGIGCPVNASIADADYVIIVTEPTKSGIHDMKRLVELLHRFKIQMGIVINKYDINNSASAQIRSYAENRDIAILGTIPFDRQVVTSQIKGENIMDTGKEFRENIRSIFMKAESEIKSQIN